MKQLGQSGTTSDLSLRQCQIQNELSMSREALELTSLTFKILIDFE